MHGQPKRDHRRLRGVTLNYPSQRRIAESGVAIRPRAPGNRAAPNFSFWRREASAIGQARTEWQRPVSSGKPSGYAVWRDGACQLAAPTAWPAF
jgi:hypothetical protein